MTAISVKVEFAWGDTWQTEAADRTWVDESAYVLDVGGLSTMRGASAARGQIDTGTASFWLDNRTRRFDPTYAAGALYGDLVPGVPCRVSVTTATPTTIRVVTGTVPAWPQRYDIGNTMGWVPVTVYDGAGRVRIPQSVMASVIGTRTPVGYWPLDDPAGSATASDVMGVTAGTVYDEPAFGSTVLAAGLGSSVEFDGTNDRIDLTRTWLVDDESECTVVAVIRVTSAAPASTIRPIFVQTGRSGGGTVRLAVDEDGYAVFHWLKNGTVTGDVYRSAFPVDDGATHLVIGCANDSGSDSGICVDTATLSTTAGSGVYLAGNGCAIGGPPNRLAGDDNYFLGNICQVAVWDRSLSTVVRGYIVDAFAALADQTTDERVGWVLDEIGWPTDMRDFATGAATLGAATFRPGDDTVSYLRALEASEDGRLFCNGDGEYVLQDRYWPWTETVATASQFEFTDAGGAGGYSEFELDGIGDDLMVNVARFTRRGGAEQVAVNTTSRDAYGEAELVVGDLLVGTDAEARSLAEWAVATRGTPLSRVPQIRVPLHAYSAADQATVLGLDVGHRVTCVRTPQGVGAAIDLGFLVDGVRVDGQGGAWWLTLYVRPATADTVELFRWDTSLLDGAAVLAP